jgi:3-hydroxyacyl-[acyl-carrier-protein] dehydratase
MRFLLVDRILELERGRRAVGVKNVTLSEDFLAYHFPDMPIMPGMLITEALVQLADWTLREASDFQELGLAVAFDRLKFRRLVRPGDQLRLEVELLGREADEVAFKGKAAVDGALVTAAEFRLRPEPIHDWLTPDEARRLFGVMYHPPEGAANGQL